jgi:hypothetical protein
MLAIEIELVRSEEELDIYTMGHLTLTGSEMTLSSKTRNQSMMIFLSITQLLYEISNFLKDKNQTSYNFVGVDCSFQFYLLKDNKIINATDAKGNIIDRIPELEIVSCFWEGIENFLLKYNYLIEKSESIYSDQDLKNSMLKFKNEFNLENRVKFFN